MQVQSSDISADFNKILVDACTRCEPVQISDGTRVIAVLQPVVETSFAPAAQAVSTVESTEVYRTWGETLSTYE